MFKPQTRRPGLLVAVATAWLTASLTYAQDHDGHRHSDPKEQPETAQLPKCPVTGEGVNLAVSTSTDQGPVFFCCSDCVPKYKVNPQQYADRVESQRASLSEHQKIQVSCPVSGDPVDTNVYTEANGQRVYFCCKGCVNKYQREPAKYQAALANGFTYQTKCPVMNEEIDPGANTVLAGGQRVYFCCPRCENDLLADPAKYLPNLKAQGYDFKPEDMKHGKAEGKDRGAREQGHDHDGHDH